TAAAVGVAGDRAIDVGGGGHGSVRVVAEVPVELGRGARPLLHLGGLALQAIHKGRFADLAAGVAQGDELRHLLVADAVVGGRHAAQQRAGRGGAAGPVVVAHRGRIPARVHAQVLFGIERRGAEQFCFGGRAGHSPGGGGVGHGRGCQFVGGGHSPAVLVHFGERGDRIVHKVVNSRVAVGGG